MLIKIFDILKSNNNKIIIIIIIIITITVKTGKTIFIPTEKC